MLVALATAAGWQPGDQTAVIHVSYPILILKNESEEQEEEKLLMPEAAVQLSPRGQEKAQSWEVIFCN